jgi:hypothetical protein
MAREGGKSEHDRNMAELRAQVSQALHPERHDPAGILAANQINPPHVRGHASEDAERAILD